MVLEADDTSVSRIRGMFDHIQKAMHVSRVFGEAYERDGAMVIPVASVRGGGGGGSGSEQDRSGEGGGFGLIARPVGVYVVKDGAATWRPSWDVNRAAAWVGVTALAYLFTAWRVRVARATPAV